MQMCEARNTINYAKVGEQRERQRERESKRENIIIIITQQNQMKQNVTGTKTITCYMGKPMSRSLCLYPSHATSHFPLHLPLQAIPIFVVNVSVCHNNFAPVNKFLTKKRKENMQNEKNNKIEKKNRISWEKQCRRGRHAQQMLSKM